MKRFLAIAVFTASTLVGVEPANAQFVFPPNIPGITPPGFDPSYPTPDGEVPDIVIIPPTDDNDTENDNGEPISPAHTNRKCTGWNSFLQPVVNVLEVQNTSPIQVEGTLSMYDSSGTETGTLPIKLSTGKQSDFIVNEITGWKENSIGVICVKYEGTESALSGRLITYKQGSNEIEFATTSPLTYGERSNQYSLYNTFNPSTDSTDPTSNWATITNHSSTSATGTLIIRDMTGATIDSTEIQIPAFGRVDYAVHSVGSNQTGLLEWSPNSDKAITALSTTRYFYDNKSGLEQFDSAVVVPTTTASDSSSATFSTKGRLSIVEISNPTQETTSIDLKVNDEAGSLVNTIRLELSKGATKHLYLNDYLDEAQGSVTLSSNNLFLSSVFSYRFNSLGAIETVSAASASTSLAGSLFNSYNSYLGQSCHVSITNVTNNSQEALLTVSRSDGTKILSGLSIDGFTNGEPLTIPANGTISYDICKHDKNNNYGTVIITPTESRSLTATIIRQGEKDSYEINVPF